MLQLKFADGALPSRIGNAPHIILAQGTQPELSAAPVAGESPQATTAAEHQGGMPQLNFSDFPPQLIWLVITFVVLMVLISKLAMPRIASVLEQRDARIKSDLDRAERVKADADAALAVYQKTMADARARAQSELRQAQTDMAAETAKREAAFAQQLAQRVKAAEDSIAGAKAHALTQLRGVGAEVAGSVLGKVAGLSLPAAQVQAAIDAATTER